MLPIDCAGWALQLLPGGAIYLPEVATLLVADAHFGKAVSFRLAGVPVPQGTTTETLQRLTDALAETTAKQVIFLGDFLHSAKAHAAPTQQAIASWQLSGDGEFTRRCHALLEGELGVPKALLTTSCTHALEMAALLLDVKPDDEVIIPSFTFVSTANAFVLRGARPVFIDIRPDTLNVDETKLEDLITPRTKAIVVVHYAGVACDMDTILQVAGRHGVPVVEDNAHGLFGKYKGRLIGDIPEDYLEWFADNVKTKPALAEAVAKALGRTGQPQKSQPQKSKAVPSLTLTE